MKRLVVVMLFGCTFTGCALPKITSANRHAYHEKTYCFLPEGCTVNGHHYNAGDVIR